MAKRLWAKVYQNKRGRVLLDVKLDWHLAIAVASGNRAAAVEVLAAIIEAVEAEEAPDQ